MDRAKVWYNFTFTADQLKDYTVSVTETALKKMKAAQDAAQDDITKEVWNDLSGKFSLNRQVGYRVSNLRVKIN